MMKTRKPYLISGGNFTDDRGNLVFNNALSFIKSKIKRFYIIENHKQNFIRAWHGHKNEGKFFLALSGTFLVCAVRIDNFKKPSTKMKVEKFILTQNSGNILHIPKGYANGLKNLTSQNQLIVFSDKSIKDSLNDDYRYDYDYWNVWKENFR